MNLHYLQVMPQNSCRVREIRGSRNAGAKTSPKLNLVGQHRVGRGSDRPAGRVGSGPHFCKFRRIGSGHSNSLFYSTFTQIDNFSGKENR
jgi:hypothetical protein